MINRAKLVSAALAGITAACGKLTAAAPDAEPTAIVSAPPVPDPPDAQPTSPPPRDKRICGAPAPRNGADPWGVGK
jgi:hypothetical protein